MAVRRVGVAEQPRKGGIVKAKVGDRLVTEGAHVDAPRRIGQIMEVPHPDGSPPYLVRWLDGQQTLCVPGPDSHLLSEADETG
jgi:Domain of unknown function (DUF1918)